MAIHGAFHACSCAAPLNIVPQDGSGGRVPSPRKLSAASLRMAVPRVEVARMI